MSEHLLLRTYVIQAGESQELLQVCLSPERHKFFVTYRHHPSKIQTTKHIGLSGDEVRILSVALTDDKRAVVAVVSYAPLRPNRIDTTLDAMPGREEVLEPQDKVQELVKRAIENQQHPVLSLATCFSVLPDDEEKERERKRQRDTPHFTFK